MADLAFIKQIALSDGNHDIEALHFISDPGDSKAKLSTPAEWRAYIDAIEKAGLKIVVDSKHATKEEPATTASADTMGKLYLVALTGQKSGSYTEFITVENPAKTYFWEKIGTTDADLTGYVQIGTFNAAAQAAGETTTSSNGGATVTAASAGAQTASGTATVTYKLAASATGETNNGTTANTGEAGAATVSGSNFTFTGTAKTLSASVTGVVIDSHNYTPAGSVSVSTTAASKAAAVTSVSAELAAAPAFTGTAATLSATGDYTPAGAISGTQSISSHTHTVTLTPGADNKETVLTDVPEPTLGGTTSFNTDAIKSAALTGTQVFNTDAIKAASLTGTKTFNTDAIKSAELDVATSTTEGDGRQAVVTAVAPSLSGNTNPVSAVDAATGSAGAHTHDVDSHTHAANTAVVNGITFTANGNDTFSAGSFTQGAKASFTQGTKASLVNTGTTVTATNIMSNATVSAAGVLSWTNATFAANGDDTFTANGNDTFTAPSFTQGSKASLTYSTVSVAGAGSAATLTAKSAGAHTHSVGSTKASISVAAGATTKYIKVATAAASTGTVGITTTAASTASVGITTTAASKGTVSISRASVSTASVLKSLPSAVVDAAGAATVDFSKATFTGTAATLAVSGSYTPAGTISKPDVNVTAPTANFNTDAIKAASASFTGTAATLAHGFTAGSMGSISIDYTPAGTIGGSQSIAAHSHSYTKPTAHTHSIALTDTTITGTAAVAVAAHTHSVTIANHTHTIGNHTHDVKLKHTPDAS